VPIPLWAWLALVAAVAVLLLVDLLVVHRDAHAIGVREAAALTALWAGLAVGFGGVLWWWQGGEAAAQYLAGYVVEWSLSLDNVFVFALIFSYFAVPEELRYRVLFWGIVLAIALRGVFIVIGASLLETFAWIAYVFGAFLVATGVKVARHADRKIEPERNPVLRLLRRVLPVTSEFEGTRLLTRVGGRRAATPLAAALLLVAVFDLVFAVDSIPAILAITTEPFVVFAANAFALLGLRSLFFLVTGSMTRFRFLNVGLGAILVLVGAKLFVSEWWKVPVWVALPSIIAILAVTALASVLAGRGGRPGPAPEDSPRGSPAVEPGGRVARWSSTRSAATRSSSLRR
jgi:tellurite resistance protein TerC